MLKQDSALGITLLEPADPSKGLGGLGTGLSLSRQSIAKSSVSQPLSNPHDEELKAEDLIHDDHNFMAKFLQEKIFNPAAAKPGYNGPHTTAPMSVHESPIVATVPSIASLDGSGNGVSSGLEAGRREKPTGLLRKGWPEK